MHRRVQYNQIYPREMFHVINCMKLLIIIIILLLYLLWLKLLGFVYLRRSRNSNKRIHYWKRCLCVLQCFITSLHINLWLSVIVLLRTSSVSRQQGKILSYKFYYCIGGLTELRSPVSSLCGHATTYTQIVGHIDCHDDPCTLSCLPPGDRIFHS